MAITQIANDNNDGFRELGMLDEPIPIGTTFADLYEVINENKSFGGMGKVILCRSKQNNKYYVLKTFKSEKYNEKIFKQEIEFTLKLEKHSNIVYTQTAIKEKDKIYMVMELIGKQPKNPQKDKWFANTLADKLKGQISPKQAFIWAIEFCRGMQYLNSIGLKSHQDIKPANIFITEDNHIKIADFGIASFTSKKKDIKGGSDGYRSPESYKKDTECDIRSDIYSFGIVIYEIFNNVINLTNKIKEIKKYNGKYCNEIIKKCLEDNPNERYQTFVDLEKELTREIKKEVGKDFKVKKSEIKKIKADDSIAKGNGYYIIERYENAIKYYNKAIQLKANSSNAYVNRGLVKRSLGNYKSALADYNRAIKLNPKSASAYNNIGSIKYDKKDYQSAARNFIKAKNLNKNYLDAYYNLGCVYLQLKKYDEAIKNYKKVLSLNFRHYKTYYNVAIIKYNLKQYQYAIKNYKKVIQINPYYLDAYYNLANILLDFKKYDEAIENYNKIIKINPNYWEAYYNMALCYSKLQKYNESISNYNILLTLKPDFMQGYNNKANDECFVKKYREAINDYTQAIKIYPYNNTLYYNRGITYLEMKEYNKAILDFQKSIKIDNKDINTYNKLIKIYKILGKTKETQYFKEKLHECK